MISAAPEYDASLLTGIRVALQKARELGYQVERMDVTASMSEGLCTVYFAPPARPGMISAGGDLTVGVDPRSEEIRQVERGQ